MQQKLYFQNSKGNKLCGVLSDPNPEKHLPVVVLCHGFASNKDRPTYIKLQGLFNDRSIATFRFDFYGTNESAGKFEDITLSEAVDDTLNAIQFLQTKGYVSFGLIGSSFGGMTSLLTAANSKDLKVLALRAPVTDYLEKIIAKISNEEIAAWKNNGFILYHQSDGNKPRVNYSFFLDAEKADGKAAARKIGIPTIIVHGDADQSVPIEQSRKTATLIKNCRLEIIKGADHRFTKPEDNERCMDLIVEFVAKHL